MFRFSLDLHDIDNPLTRLIVGKNSFINHAEDWGIYFLKPASPIMYGIVELHDFIMIYLVFIVFFVTFMLSIILKESTITESNDLKKFYKVRSLYNVKFNHHTTLETIWILVPSIILLTIAVPSFIILYAMDIIPSHDFSIKVVGHQWYWSYEYIMENIFLYDNMMDISVKTPHKEYEMLHRYSFDSYMIPSDELQSHQTRLLDTTNPLVIPVAKYASVTVTSCDVIHSFTVPSLGFKVDAVPGRLNTISMYVMELGHYYGQCSELCGVNHGFMPIEIYCVDMVGFSIYKAALASKIVTKDIVSTELDMLTKWQFLKVREDYINSCLEKLLITKKTQTIEKFIYYKRSIDVRFLKKVIAAGKVYENLNWNEGPAFKIKD